MNIPTPLYGDNTANIFLNIESSSWPNYSHLTAVERTYGYKLDTNDQSPMGDLQQAGR